MGGKRGGRREGRREELPVKATMFLTINSTFSIFQLWHNETLTLHTHTSLLKAREFWSEIYILRLLLSLGSRAKGSIHCLSLWESSALLEVSYVPHDCQPLCKNFGIYNSLSANTH